MEAGAEILYQGFDLTNPFHLPKGITLRKIVLLDNSIGSTKIKSIFLSITY